ncbi:MAG: response regulator [Acidobacteria bacterium]|nr:response regulator [Acidobacteriota bacterium]
MPKTRKGTKTAAPLPGRHGLLSTGDVARVCGVTRDGVAHWIRAGKLPAFRTPGGHFRVRDEHLRDFLRKSGGGPVTCSSGRRILVVDDELAIRALLQDLLTEAGYQVQVAATMADALEKADALPPHLVITDVALPGGDGTALARSLRARPAMAGVPIIAVTGAFDSQVTARVYDAGIDLLLAKPFRPDQMVGEVRRLLESGAVAAMGESAP